MLAIVHFSTTKSISRIQINVFYIERERGGEERRKGVLGARVTLGAVACVISQNGAILHFARAHDIPDV